MNIGVHVSFQISVFGFFGYTQEQNYQVIWQFYFQYFFFILISSHFFFINCIYFVLYNLFFITVELIYNVSGIQQSNSYIFFFRFFSIIGYYKILNIVPCAVCQVLVGYLFYIQYCASVNPKFLIYPYPLHFPLW